MANLVAEVLEYIGEEWRKVFRYTGLALIPAVFAAYYVTGDSIMTKVLVITEANILFGMGFASALILIANLLKERDDRE